MRATHQSLLGLLFLAFGFGSSYGDDAEYTRNVAVILYEGVEVADFAGAAQVLGTAAQFAEYKGQPAYNLFTVGPDTDPVQGSGFVTIVPDYGFEEAPRPDVLLMPGGSWGSLADDEAFVDWIRAAAGEGVTLTVCTGAAAAASAGLMDGKRATSWHRTLDQLQARHPNVEFVGDVPYVDGGNIVSASHAAKGFDAALHLTARDLGLDVAQQTASYLGYQWTPNPDLAAEYNVLNPRLDERGRKLQRARIHERSGEAKAAVGIYQDLLGEDASSKELWYEYGKVLAKAGQYEDAIEAYLTAAESNTRRANALYNAACAASLAGETERAFSFLEQSVQAGFRYPDYMMRDEDLAPLRADPRFKALVTRARSTADND